MNFWTPMTSEMGDGWTYKYNENADKYYKQSMNYNNVFEMPPDFDDSYYEKTIYEIIEMQIVNMGNYAHGNKPIQHMIYLYNFIQFDDLQNGGEFIFHLGGNPDKNWGSQPENIPYSLSDEK